MLYRSYHLFVVLQVKDGRSIGHASQQTSPNLRGELKQKAKARQSSIRPCHWGAENSHWLLLVLLVLQSSSLWNCR